MRNIKLIIEYDGTNYRGWQMQESRDRSLESEVSHDNPNSRPVSRFGTSFDGNDEHNVLTIQGILEKAIKNITGEHIKLTGAGRTDSGVHAKGQTANFYTSSDITVDRFPFAINAQLPQDIVVKSAEEVPLNFNARKDATAREYMYVINNHRFRSALKRLYSYHVPFELDIQAMRQAAGYLIGEHDFTGFAFGNRGKRTRNIMKLVIEKKDDFLYITVKANSFLMHMVRYIVAALLEAGNRKMKPEDIKFYLEPILKKWTHSRAPAKGLFLMKVEY